MSKKTFLVALTALIARFSFLDQENQLTEGFTP